MRTLALLLSLAVSTSAAAAGIRFEPAAPDNRSWITARVYSSFCAPLDPKVTISGNRIDIAIEPVPGIGCLAIVFQIPLEAQLGMLAPGVYDVHVSGPWAYAASDTLVVRDTREFRVVPAGVPVAGGTKVKLARTAGSTWPSYPLGVTVQFGDAAPQPGTLEAGGNIVVTAPPHAPGLVDVRVRTTLASGVAETIARNAFTYYNVGAAPDRTIFEPLLFPVAYEGDGAFGSKWTTESWITPGSATFFMPPCASCVADARGRLRLDPVSAPAGIVLWPARGTIETLGTSSRVRDVTKQADNAGAYVPVARESDFRRTIVFPDVPNAEKYRITLRVWSLEEPQLKPSASYLFTGARAGDIAFNTQAAPGIVYAQLDLTDKIRPLPGAGIDVSITGETRSWGIISVTNNETQQVTIVAPYSGDPRD